MPEEWVPETESDRGLAEMLEPTIAGAEEYLDGP
jgi:hypothetical protein